ncbi:MAG: aminopeptidase [bacterium]|nr:aminopeptidase [bacterium]
MRRGLPDAVRFRCSTRQLDGNFFRLSSLTLCVLFLNGCGVGYLWHVTAGQMSLLSRQQPVEEVLQSTTLSDQEEKKVRLILAARSFAIEQLGMDASNSYTTFVQIDGLYVSYNLSAAPKDALQPYIWRFPIVGRLPYKGFFNKEKAIREQRKLDAQGYDTYVRGVRAYSTLGYFDDPILSSMLRSHDFTLINTIIHELLHQTVWIKGNVSFNESLANFIGEKGTIAYLARRYGETSAELQHYRDMRADAAVFRAYMRALIDRLETLYQLPLSVEEKRKRREPLFAAAKRNYSTVFPQMKTTYYRRYFERQTLNNAVLLSFRRYNRNMSYFDDTLAAHGGDLRRMIAYFKTLRADQLPERFAQAGSKSP